MKLCHASKFQLYPMSPSLFSCVCMAIIVWHVLLSEARLNRKEKQINNDEILGTASLSFELIYQPCEFYISLILSASI